MKIGIIGSTGIKIELLTNEYEFRNIEIEGKIFKYYYGKVNSHEIFLVARNNYEGSVPPHLVEYTGIMKMFKLINVDFVVATSVVGSLSVDFKPGEYVVLNQFIDMTKTSPHTVYKENAFAFVDFTNPYCKHVREFLIKACENLQIPCHKAGCYVGVDGPRYETAAEVRAFRILGGDVVGMTNVKEAVMARELGICYASIAIISNYGAGIATEEILRKDCYNKTIEVLEDTVSVIKELLNIARNYENCPCKGKNSDMLYTDTKN